MTEDRIVAAGLLLVIGSACQQLPMIIDNLPSKMQGRPIEWEEINIDLIIVIRVGCKARRDKLTPLQRNPD
jgi:hypothetical protein